MTTTAQPAIPRSQAGTPTHAFRLSTVFQAVALYAVSFAVLSVLIFTSPGFVGNDDYYHARMGGEIFDQGRLAINFPWLPHTLLNSQAFVDHHLLYHIYLAPFVHFAAENGAKLAQVAVAAGIVLGLWWLLKSIGVRWEAVWSLAFFGLSSPFLLRMLMIRTQGMSVLLLVIALHILFQRRYRWLIPLSFAYAWLYDGFILMPIFAALYVGAAWLSERRLDLRPLVYSLVGVALGLVINPYFPHNLQFIIDHLGAKVDFESGVQVGSEWYPYTTSLLLANSGGALLVLLVGFLRPSLTGHKRDTVENTLLLAALVTLFMLLRSRRFIEYYPPFALLFCAAAWGRSTLSIWDALPRRLGLLLPYAAVIAGLVFVGSTYAAARSDLQNGDDPRWFVGASNWLKAHTPAGTPVFQTDWDDFTRLFYYNTSNTYLVGLDPTYLQLTDPDLWDEWVAITRGQVEQPSTVIETRFGMQYVVSDRDHIAFADRASGDPRMKLVYWDKNSMLWQITPAVP